MNHQKQQLVEIAYGQFKQLGFKNVTVDDLARVMGISKKTLYEHFEDKDEIVLESVKHMLAENEEKTKKVFRESGNAIEQITQILMLMEKLTRGMNMVCYHDLQRYYPNTFKYVTQHKETFLLKCIKDNLIQGIEEGNYREDVDIEIVSRFRMESAMLTFQNNIFPHDKFDIVKVNSQLFAVYMYGISTVKGHKLITKHLEKLSKK